MHIHYFRKNNYSFITVSLLKLNIKLFVRKRYENYVKKLLLGEKVPEDSIFKTDSHLNRTIMCFGDDIEQQWP